MRTVSYINAKEAADRYALSVRNWLSADDLHFPVAVTFIGGREVTVEIKLEPGHFYRVWQWTLQAGSQEFDLGATIADFYSTLGRQND